MNVDNNRSSIDLKFDIPTDINIDLIKYIITHNIINDIEAAPNGEKFL